MKRYLFLDDIRMPGDVTWVPIGDGKGYYCAQGAPWEIVRSYKEAIDWVMMHGFPNVISFDHDLGYEEFDTNENGIIVVTNATEEKSGYDFAKWLCEYDMDTHTMPEDFSFTVHSMNEIGTRNIQMYLDNYIRRK